MKAPVVTLKQPGNHRPHAGSICKKICPQRPQPGKYDYFAQPESYSRSGAWEVFTEDESAYLFGAICPARGTGAALAMPYADSEAMQLHLVEVSSRVRRGAHAVLLLDRAGWHTTRRLVVPKNITLVFLPSRAPELNPVENIWQYLRQNWLSNRVFETYEAIIEAACEAWRSLLAEPTTITSIGHRGWAHVGQK